MNFLYKIPFLKKYGTILLGVFLFLHTACSSVPEHSQRIPVEATAVLTVNLAKVTSEASNWQDLIGEEFLKKITSIGAKNAKAWSENLHNSGIDITESVHLFVFSPAPNAPLFTAMVLPISSTEKFRTFVENTPDKKWKVSESEKMQFVLVDARSILAWKDDIAILLQSSTKTSPSDLQKNALNLHNLPEKKALVEKNESFAQAQQTHKDHAVTFWLNVSQFDKIAQNQASQTGLPNLDLSNNFLTSFIDFEKGKIVITGDFAINGSQKQYEDFLASGVSNTLLDRCPFDEPMALLLFHLDTQKIQSTIEALGIPQELMKKVLETTLSKLAQEQYPTIEPFLREMPADEIFRLLDGDVMLALKGIKEVNYTIETINEEGEADLKTNFRLDFVTVWGFTLKDKEGVLQWLTTIRQASSRLNDKGMFFQLKGEKKMDFFFIVQDNLLFVTSNADMRNDILARKKTQLSERFKPTPENWLFAYANVSPAMRKRLPPTLFDNDKRKEEDFKKAHIPFEKINSSFDAIKDDKMSFNIEITTDEADKNALVTLINWIKSPEKIYL